MGVCMSQKSIQVNATSKIISSVKKISTDEFKLELNKQDSNLNLIPQELHQKWFETDESKYDREKVLLVLCSNADETKCSKIILINIDYLNQQDYMKIISQLDLPNPGDDLMFSCWDKITNENSEINSLIRNTLIVPCVNTSNIYYISISEQLELAVSKQLTKQDLICQNVSSPLSIMVFSKRKKSFLIVCTLADQFNNPKGHLIKLDQKPSEKNLPIDKKNNNMLNKNLFESEKLQSCYLGGSIALLYRLGYLFSTEWSNINTPQNLLNNKQKSNIKFGNSINIWNVEKQKLIQTINLDSIDGELTISIRFLHHRELKHGFVCSAIGGCIFHIHQNTKSGLFSAHRVAKFANVAVDGWISKNLPSFPVDMIISMDDNYLYVSCWLQGFIARFDISDPFQPTLMNRIFMGGIIQKSFGVKLINNELNEFKPKSRIISGCFYEGGPAHLQLSLDGRRLYVSNSFLRSWDEYFYPNLIINGSTIAFIHIDQNKPDKMMLDNFGINLGKKFENNEFVYLAKGMRFLNGDSTSD